MTDIGNAVMAALAADAGVSAIAADRIVPDILPDLRAGPVVVVTVISDADEHTTDGPLGFPLARVQVDAWASGRLAARQLAQACDEVFGAVYNTVLGSAFVLSAWADTGGMSNRYDAEVKWRYVTTDYLIRYAA